MSYSISMNHQRRSSRGGGKPCRFGDTCRNSNCRFEHSVQPIMTTSSSNNNSRDTRRSRGPCRSGAGCTRPDCWFDHPLKQERPAANAPMTYSFEIQGPAAVDAPKAATTTSSQNITNESIQSSKAYRFCSSQECRERQELGQVSVFEATAETANLPQNQRCLDPTLAVAKYRRSAAGTTHTSQQSKESLELLLQHLVTIAATRRPTPQHSPVDDWQGPWTEFLVDRLRACQADATRLFGQASGSILPSTWHTIMARLLIWIRYWMPWKQADKFLEQTLAAMLSTAMDHYWSTCQVERGMKKGDTNMDDEMLCYAALSRLSQHCSGSSPAASSSLGESSVSSTALGANIILDYSKHLLPTAQRNTYPLFQEALKLTTEWMREEYYGIIRRTTVTIPILARCCLAPALAHARYRQCQQYNVSFGKDEAVLDLDVLLNISADQWTRSFAERLLRLPCQNFESSSHENNQNFAVVFKQVAMANDPSLSDLIGDDPWYKQDHNWTFGAREKKKEHDVISDDRAKQLIMMGRIE